MSETRSRRIWVVSELYRPEETSTGHVVTTIAEGLATDAGLDVQVVCGQPTYSRRGVSAPKTETFNGVKIRRVWSTTQDQTKTIGRLINLLTLSLSVAISLSIRLRRGDQVLAVTNPPTIPYVAMVAAKLRGASVSPVIHDMFPEILQIGNPNPSAGLATRVLDRLSAWLYRHSARIVVLGPDQRDRIAAKIGDDARSKVVVIPISRDTGFDEVIDKTSSSFYLTRLADQAAGKIVFQVAGNMGPLQGIPFLTEAIGKIQNNGAHFCFVGAGRSRALLEDSLGSHPDVSIFDPVARADAPDLHAGCDVIIISLTEGMWGISVPSRIGNALASGRPILGICDADSALDQLVKQHDVGWSIRPGDLAGFDSAVAEATSQPQELLAKADRARELAQSAYTMGGMIDAYGALFSSPDRVES